MLAHPEIERYKSDYIAVASNAKLCADVIAVSNQPYIDRAPLYAQEAIFNCYVSTQAFPKTEALAKSILKVHGKNESIELSMVTLARDQKQFKSALFWSERFIQDFPNNVSAWELRTGTLQDIGDRYAALQIYEDINRLKPKDPSNQQQIIQVLLGIGISHLALDLIDNKDWNASKNQKLRAMHDAGAIDLRWSAADSAVAPNRFNSTDAGIQMLAEALSYAKSINAPKDQILAIQFDFVVAYARRKQWDKALGLYDQLLSEGVAVPSYVQSAAATSYSAKHEYAKAEAILQKLHAQNPKDLDTLEALYYSLVDQDKFPEAKVALDNLTAQLKVRPKHLPKRNFDYTSAVIEAASFEAYQEKYEEVNKKTGSPTERNSF